MVKYFAIVCVWCLAIGQALGAEDLRFDCLIEPQMTIKLGSPVQGIIEEIPVKRGDTVHKGQVVARLQSSLEENAVEQAQNRFEYLQKQYERLTIVKGKALASDEIVEQAKSEMETAGLEVKRRKILLDQRSIASPVDAIVVDAMLSPGEYVYEQAPVLSLAKTDTLNVEVLVPIPLYGRIAEGMKARVVPEEPEGVELEATVEVFDRVMDAASSTFGVRLILANPDLTVPAGQKCQVVFGI